MGNTLPLFDFTDLNPDLLPALFTLHIVFQMPSAFAEDAIVTASRLLAQAGRMVQHCPPRQQVRYIGIVTAAISRSNHQVLGPACVAAIGLSMSDNEKVQASIERFLDILETSQAALRRDVWRGLQGQAGSLHVDQSISRRKIAFLLKPIYPLVLEGTIRSSLSQHLCVEAANRFTKRHGKYQGLFASLGGARRQSLERSETQACRRHRV